MAKIKRYTVEDTFSWVAFSHWPYPWDTPGASWHEVHEYTGDIYDYMGAIMQYSIFYFPDPTTAKSCALTLISLNAVLTDICPDCHDTHFHIGRDVGIPRWNIYRGRSGEISTPAFYWDLYDPTTPDGFKRSYP
jgi:hypothetical protein